MITKYIYYIYIVYRSASNGSDTFTSTCFESSVMSAYGEWSSCSIDIVCGVGVLLTGTDKDRERLIACAGGLGDGDNPTAPIFDGENICGLDASDWILMSYALFSFMMNTETTPYYQHSKQIQIIMS